jgi:hypothetical protein
MSGATIRIRYAAANGCAAHRLARRTRGGRTAIRPCRTGRGDVIVLPEGVARGGAPP